MNSAIHGVRRIAREFNEEMRVMGRMINIGKSRIHEIVASAKIYKHNTILKNKPKHLKRPEEPLQNFSMDFTRKRLGNGEIGYIFGLLDMHNNAVVRNYCRENNILLHIIPKASPWIQAFIERSFRTLKQEFLNLVWIGNWNRFTDVLDKTKFEYNHRPHSSFNYNSPFQIMNEAIIKYPQHVCGH